MSVSQFLDEHFRHFNARELVAAARGWRELVDSGGKMFLAIAGAMSTAEIGRSLAPLIRAGKVHAISCTAANLEEDFFNLVGNQDYELVPDYRDLSADDEVTLRDRGFNRVTDTCIPETVIRRLEEQMMVYWTAAVASGTAYTPWEYFSRLVQEPWLDDVRQVPREVSWVIAAAEMQIPVYVPGFEDSTLGNVFAAHCLDGTVGSHNCVKSGTMQMAQLVEWYLEQQEHAPIGFFQIGGGIAGDFAICAVPLIVQDLRRECRLWSYFAQISDSTTSYGSYSGAVPNEKITWWKLDRDAPKFMINSDASIVAPLVFAYVMGE